MSESAEIDHALGYRARLKGNMMNKILAIALFAANYCAAADKSETEQARDQAASEIRAEIDKILPTCQDATACSAIWEAAKHWAASHPSGSHLHIKNNKITVVFRIDRYQHSAFIEMKPLPEGGSYLDIKILCIPLNMFLPGRCGIQPEYVRLDLYKSVSAATHH